MKCFCHTTNIAAVLGNAPSLLDVAWWNRGHGKNGAGWNQTPLDYWSLHRCDVAESGQAAQGEGYYELLFWWCSKKLPTVEMIRAECQSTFCQSKNKTCMLRHSPPFPTTLLFKHIHARRQAYLNPWSVNSAFVGFHCGAYLWSEGGCAKAVCVHLRVCVWDEMTFPVISGLTPGPITTQNLGLIKCTEGQMPDLQEFPTSASVIFQPSPFLQTWTMAFTCSVHSKCETDTSNFPVRLQCMR